MTETKNQKTNKRWYPYEKDGVYWKLEDGELMECPMNADGTRDDTPYEVDMDYGVEEKEKPMLQEIVKELEGKE